VHGGGVDFLFKPLNREALRSKVKVFVEFQATVDAVAAAISKIELARASLARLRERGLSTLTREGETEWERSRS
jgi:FixJ family two-component response regulator